MHATAPLHRHFRFRLPWSTACLLLLGGCTSGQIGGEVSEGGLTSDGCVVTSDHSLSADESTSLGVTAREAAESMTGHFVTSLLWLDETTAATVDVTPAAGETDIDVTIEPVLSSARLLSVEPGESGMEGGVALGLAQNCDDLIAIDARVTVRTGNGALDDSFDTTFAVEPTGLARTTIPLSLADLVGTFEVTPPENRPAARITQLGLQLQLALGTLSGRISGGLEETDGTVTSYAGLTFGTFPAHDDCVEGVPVAEDSALAEEAAGIITNLMDFELTWTSAEATPVTISTTTAGACLNTQGETRVVIHVTSQVTAADESIDGRWKLEGHVTFDGSGQPLRVELFRQAYLAETFAPGTFAEQSGITKYSVDDEREGTFSFSVSDDLTDELPATGEITIIEVTPSECSTQEPPDPGESEDPTGSVAPSGSCTGIEADEIGGGTLVAASDLVTSD